MKKRGFISELVIIILALAALKYFFDWSIFDAINSEKGQATIAYLKDVLNSTWLYLKNFAIWIKGKI